MVYKNKNMIGGFNPRAVASMSEEEFMRRHAFWNNPEDLASIYAKCKEIVQSGDYDDSGKRYRNGIIKKEK